MALILPLTVSLLLGGIAGYLGSLMVSRRMALVGGPLGHLALPGVALALLFNFNIFWGALFTVVLGILVIWLLEKKTVLPIEAITAVVFACGVALGFLLLPLDRAEEAVIGNIVQIGLFDFFLTLFFTAIVFFVLSKKYNELVIASVSLDLARAKKIKVDKNSFLLLFLIAIVTALAVKIIGILLTAALFAIPASASRNISRNLFECRFFSIFFGCLSAAGGVALFSATGLPAGPLMILSAGTIFLFSLGLKKIL